MNDRFGPFQQLVAKGHQLVPAVIAESSSIPDMKELFTKYEDDLPSPLSIAAELHVWWQQWREARAKQEKLPSDLGTALKKACPMLFPNINRMLRLLATVPVTSVECERSISTLGLVKTDLRSRMHQQRLNGLALMSKHYSRNVDVEAIINAFATLHPRRMALGNLLSATADDECD